eukprot:g660.t1
MRSLHRTSPRHGGKGSAHHEEHMTPETLETSLSRCNIFASDHSVSTTLQAIDMFRPSKEELWKTKMTENKMRLAGEVDNIVVPEYNTPAFIGMLILPHEHRPFHFPDHSMKSIFAGGAGGHRQHRGELRGRSPVRRGANMRASSTRRSNNRATSPTRRRGVSPTRSGVRSSMHTPQRAGMSTKKHTASGTSQTTMLLKEQQISLYNKAGVYAITQVWYGRNATIIVDGHNNCPKFNVMFGTHQYHHGLFVRIVANLFRISNTKDVEHIKEKRTMGSPSHGSPSSTRGRGRLRSPVNHRTPGRTPRSEARSSRRTGPSSSGRRLKMKPLTPAQERKEESQLVDSFGTDEGKKIFAAIKADPKKFIRDKRPIVRRIAEERHKHHSSSSSTHGGSHNPHDSSSTSSSAQDTANVCKFYLSVLHMDGTHVTDCLSGDLLDSKDIVKALSNDIPNLGTDGESDEKIVDYIHQKSLSDGVEQQGVGILTPFYSSVTEVEIKDMATLEDLLFRLRQQRAIHPDPSETSEGHFVADLRIVKLQSNQSHRISTLRTILLDNKSMKLDSFLRKNLPSKKDTTDTLSQQQNIDSAIYCFVDQALRCTETMARNGSASQLMLIKMARAPRFEQDVKIKSMAHILQQAKNITTPVMSNRIYSTKDIKFSGEEYAGVIETRKSVTSPTQKLVHEKILQYLDSENKHLPKNKRIMSIGSLLKLQNTNEIAKGFVSHRKLRVFWNFILQQYKKNKETVFRAIDYIQHGKSRDSTSSSEEWANKNLLPYFLVGLEKSDAYNGILVSPIFRGATTLGSSEEDITLSSRIRRGTEIDGEWKQEGMRAMVNTEKILASLSDNYADSPHLSLQCPSLLPFHAIFHFELEGANETTRNLEIETVPGGFACVDGRMCVPGKRYRLHDRSIVSLGHRFSFMVVDTVHHLPFHVSSKTSTSPQKSKIRSSPSARSRSARGATTRSLTSHKTAAASTPHEMMESLLFRVSEADYRLAQKYCAEARLRLQREWSLAHGHMKEHVDAMHGHGIGRTVDDIVVNEVDALVAAEIEEKKDTHEKRHRVGPILAAQRTLQARLFTLYRESIREHVFEDSIINAVSMVDEANVIALAMGNSLTFQLCLHTEIDRVHGIDLDDLVKVGCIEPRISCVYSPSSDHELDFGGHHVKEKETLFNVSASNFIQVLDKMRKAFLDADDSINSGDPSQHIMYAKSKLFNASTNIYSLCSDHSQFSTPPASAPSTEKNIFSAFRDVPGALGSSAMVHEIPQIREYATNLKKELKEKTKLTEKNAKLQTELKSAKKNLDKKVKTLTKQIKSYQEHILKMDSELKSCKKELDSSKEAAVEKVAERLVDSFIQDAVESVASETINKNYLKEETDRADKAEKELKNLRETFAKEKKALEQKGETDARLLSVYRESLSDSRHRSREIVEQVRELQKRLQEQQQSIAELKTKDAVAPSNTTPASTVPLGAIKAQVEELLAEALMNTWEEGVARAYSPRRKEQPTKDGLDNGISEKKSSHKKKRHTTAAPVPGAHHTSSPVLYHDDPSIYNGPVPYISAPLSNSEVTQCIANLSQSLAVLESRVTPESSVLLSSLNIEMFENALKFALVYMEKMEEERRIFQTRIAEKLKMMGRQSARLWARVQEYERKQATWQRAAHERSDLQTSLESRLEQTACDKETMALENSQLRGELAAAQVLIREKEHLIAQLNTALQRYESLGGGDGGNSGSSELLVENLMNTEPSAVPDSGGITLLTINDDEKYFDNDYKESLEDRVSELEAINQGLHQLTSSTNMDPNSDTMDKFDSLLKTVRSLRDELESKHDLELHQNQEGLTDELKSEQ